MNLRVLSLCLVLAPGVAPTAELQLSEAQQATVQLKTAPVVVRAARAQLQFSGVLTADRRKSHRVAPIVEGMVTELRVVENEQVRKGQVLARLRSHGLGLAQASYLEAAARFNLARAERARIESLWKEGIVAESRWLSVDSEFKSARATLEARRRLLVLAGLSDAEIEKLVTQPDRLAVLDLSSPIDGIVSTVAIEPGQLLAAGELAFEVDDLSTLWAMVQIPVSSLPQVEIGAKAMIHVSANPGESYIGELESVGGVVDTTSQTLTGRIVLENPDGVLRPGMYADIVLEGVAREGLMVPASAVFRIGDSAYVFKVLGKGRYEPVPVETGPEREGWVPVYRGIEAGTVIVTAGVAELKSHWQYQGGEQE